MKEGAVHVVSDGERRDVAERLRRAWANVSDKNPVRHHMRVLYEIYAAVGLNDDGVDAIDLFDRLADLIDPDCEEGRYSVARTVRPVDREALLALADDVDGAADDSGGFEPLAGMLRDIARSIREACGEVVA